MARAPKASTAARRATKDPAAPTAAAASRGARVAPPPRVVASRKRGAPPQAAPQRAPAPVSLAKPRKPMKAGEALARDIVRFIIDNDLPAGTRLPVEKDMLQSTGRARSTLREALRHLESRGVISIRQGITGGPVVRRPRSSDLAEILTLILHLQGASLLDVIFAREEMEALTVMRAAGRLGASELDALEQSIEVQLAHLDDREVFLRESRRFHASINAAADAPVLKVLNEALQATTHVAIGDVHFDTGHRRRVALAHRRILAGLRAGDARAAADAMREHVRESGD